MLVVYSYLSSIPLLDKQIIGFVLGFMGGLILVCPAAAINIWFKITCRCNDAEFEEEEMNYVRKHRKSPAKYHIDNSVSMISD